MIIIKNKKIKCKTDNKDINIKVAFVSNKFISQKLMYISLGLGVFVLIPIFSFSEYFLFLYL